MPTLYPLPDFATHRDVSAAGGVPADQPIFDCPVRGTIDCRGYESVRVLARLSGGIAPTIEIQHLQLVRDDDGTAYFVAIGSPIGGVSDLNYADLVVNGGRIYVRISAVAGAPTRARLLVAGAKRDLPGVGAREA